MVGRRQRIIEQSSNTHQKGRYYDDEETANGPRPGSRFGSKDVAHLALAENRRNDLKAKLLEGVSHFNLEKYRKSDEEIKQMQKKKIREFYKAQNDKLNVWLEVDALVHALADNVLDSMNPDSDHDGLRDREGPLYRSGGTLDDFLPQDEREKRRNDAKKAKWAININVLANVLLLAAKVVAVFSTGSLSLIASLTDSALDLLCTIIVWSTTRLVQWRLSSLKTKFPVGRRRLEPLGILVFSVIMVVSFLQILQESVTKLLPGGKHDTASLPAVAIGAMAGNAIVKGLIGLGCLKIKTTQVQALVQDCKTDVYFNTASLLFPLIGHRFDIWWLDPLGAALLSLYIIYDWASTCLENVSRLTGSSIDEGLQKKLLFLAWRFSPVVEGFKSLTAYHAGDGVWVEVDVLLDEKTPLPRAHDVAETLQYCYEGLREVDRAFVTVDYSSLGPTGHVTESG